MERSMRWPKACGGRGRARGRSPARRRVSEFECASRTGALRVTYGQAVTRPVRYLRGERVVGLSDGEMVVRMTIS
jgi:hypothetical protein